MDFYFRAHIKSVHKGRDTVYECDICGCQCQNKGTLLRHLKKNHKNEAENENDINVPELTQTVIKVRTKSKKKLKRLKKF